MIRLSMLLVTLALTAPAFAAPPGLASANAVTARFSAIDGDLGRASTRGGGVVRSSEQHNSPDWEQELELTLDLGLPARPAPTQDRLNLRLPTPTPDSLMLSLSLDPAWSVYVTADLSSELPRLDAVDGDTYFTVGSACRLTPELSVFCEDFQPASMVLGASDEDPAPPFAWDGHQVAVGARWQQGRVRLEAAAVAYVLSVSGRSTGLGCQGSLTVGF